MDPGRRGVLPTADEKSSGPAPAVVVAMKGHPGSGKSTAARAIAAALRCPLLDKDDVRDCTLPLEGAVPAGTLNELSYAVLWRVVERQVRLGLSAVVDSPLSRAAHLEALTRLPAALLVIVECRAVDENEWRRRLEERGAYVGADDGGTGGWHKPKMWAELERLLEGYQGCTDYDIGDVPSIVVDTTDPMLNAEAIAVKFSVLDGVFFWSKTRGACYFAGARAILGDVQARGVPSCYWKSYDVDTAIAVIQDGSVSLKVDTQHLRDISFRKNSMYQFIGELLIRPDNEAVLQARIGRNVDGLDLNLYQQSLLIRRRYEDTLRSSR